MGYFHVLAILLLTAATLVQSQSALLEAEANFPSCALRCMAMLIPQSSCNITDLPCICANVPLNANITICASSTCTIKELLTTKNVSMTMCGAEIRDRTNQVSYIGVGGGILALLAFLLRMGSRMMKGSTGKYAMGLDDVMMCLLVALAIPPTIFSVLLARNGLGKDMWTIPFDNITQLLYYYFLGENFYLAAIAVNKIVLLILIFRVFGDASFRKYVYLVIALCAGYGVGFVFATIFQCSPVKYSWHNWDGEHEGRCNNIHLQGWLSAAFNIVLDIMVLALPMPKLLKLKLSLKKKAMVLWMFSLGIFVTVVSIVRLHSLIEFANSQNVTWDYVPAAYWSTIELHLGIVCASLPAIRSLLTNVFPKILGSSNGLSTNNTELASKYTSNSTSRGFPFPVSKGPQSPEPDPFGSTERFNFFPMEDVEAQDQKVKAQANASSSSSRDT